MKEYSRNTNSTVHLLRVLALVTTVLLIVSFFSKTNFWSAITSLILMILALVPIDNLIIFTESVSIVRYRFLGLQKSLFVLENTSDLKAEIIRNADPDGFESDSILDSVSIFAWLFYKKTALRISDQHGKTLITLRLTKDEARLLEIMKKSKPEFPLKYD